MRSTLATWVRTVRRAVAHAGPERDTGLLLAKASIATVVAWQVAVHLLDSPQPFYAPLAALLVVDETMVRSLGASAQRIAAVVLGMSVAWLVGSVVGVSWWTMVPVMLVALLLGRWRRLGDHGLQVPTLVLLSLLTVHGTDTQFTYLTIVETVVGGVIGVAVNAVVLAPLHIQQPRDAVRSLTSRVRRLLHEMATGLREGWDADLARRWYDTSTEIVQTAPEVLETIETGRESTRLNPRHDLRPVDIDWAGYERTVETVRRSQWQVSGIARTLVDAADEAERLPVPSRDFLERYAEALDAIGCAVDHFGLRDDEDQAEVDRHLRAALEVLDQLGAWVRETPLDDPHAWPAYGALILDAQRLARELAAKKEEAAVPTDSGPIRLPLQDRLKQMGSAG
ncbi:aromatic acid exporter family protein [Knoellia sp. p5-6-4]|uniref:FUSC family protein n=1 Tax=unclassified Knoellia TaxID=2618719 RepID=UPI0023D9BAB6|nr:FUSC family protein [Knoellia sp. p5-6-4]MDF2143388.1 aromatic acid exporter family protein [Knoellia sp. p5-6-4]